MRNSSLWRRIQSSLISTTMKINMLLHGHMKNLLIIVKLQFIGIETMEFKFVLQPDQQSQLGMEERPDQRT